METAQNPVSLVMIVRNEAEQLSECLAPVAKLFGEIVVVDTGSRDNTLEIARRFTPHVYPYEWCDDFSAARNECLKWARGEWVFWLDADDRLRPTQIEPLRNLLNGCAESPARSYMLDTICVGREGEAGHVITHPRLFRRHAALRWQGRVHEQLRPCPSELGYEICYSDVQIEHVGYRDSSVCQRKWQRDVRLLRMDYAADPQDPSTLLHLGQAYAQLGKAADARKYLQQLLALEQRPLAYLSRVYATLASLALGESQFGEALQIAELGLQSFPEDDHLTYIKAEALYELDCYPAAAIALTEIVSRTSTPVYRAGTPSEIRTLLAPRSLGEVLRIQGQLAGAEHVLLAVARKFPGDAVTWHALGRVYIDQRRGDQVIEAAERLSECPSGQSLALLLMAAWDMAIGQIARAEETLSELIGREPNMAVARLMRVECLNRRGASRLERLQANRDVLRLQPGNAAAAAQVQELQAVATDSMRGLPPAVWQSTVLTGTGL